MDRRGGVNRGRLQDIGTCRVNEELSEFLETLSPEDAQLLVLRDELYDGSWTEMQRDLEARRSGKPFIFALVNRIEEDLERIDRLARFEQQFQINLADHV